MSWRSFDARNFTWVHETLFMILFGRVFGIGGFRVRIRSGIVGPTLPSNWCFLAVPASDVEAVREGMAY